MIAFTASFIHSAVDRPRWWTGRTARRANTTKTKTATTTIISATRQPLFLLLFMVKDIETYRLIKPNQPRNTYWSHSDDTWPSEDLTRNINVTTLIAALSTMDAELARMDFYLWRNCHCYPLPLTTKDSQEFHSSGAFCVIRDISMD